MADKTWMHEAQALARRADRDAFLDLVGSTVLDGTPDGIWTDAERSFKTGAFRHAAERFGQFAELREKDGSDPWLRWHALLRGAHAQLRLGQYVLARDRSPLLHLQLDSRPELSPFRCEVLAFDALIFEHKGILEKTAALFQLAYESAMSFGDLRRAASFASETGRAIALLGRLGVGWDWQRRAEDLAESAGSGLLRRQIVTRKASLLRALEQYTEAAALCQAALAMPNAQQQPEAMIAALTNFAELEVVLGNFDPAVRYLDEALEIAREAELKFRIIYLHRDRARLFFTRGESGDLERSHEQLQLKLGAALALPLMPRHLVEHLATDLITIERELGKDGRKRITDQLEQDLNAYRKTLRPHLFGQRQRMKNRRAASRKVRESLKLFLEPWAQFETCRVSLQTGICRFSGRFERLGKAQLDVLICLLRAKGRPMSEADLQHELPAVSQSGLNQRLKRLRRKLGGNLQQAPLQGLTHYFIQIQNQFQLERALAERRDSGSAADSTGGATSAVE